MFRKEDFESWNQLFPDCKIVEADLTHPTEIFLTKTLVSYLRSLGYRCDPPYSLNETIDNNKAKRNFLAYLTKQIDHIYKITDKSYSFSTYDLLKPTPKKTCHLLGILLNYLFYYNMYKTNIVDLVTGKIKERRELKKLVTSEEKENEEMALMVKKRKEEIEELTIKLPNIKQELSFLTSELAAKKELSHKIHADIEELRKNYNLLEQEKMNLERQTVSENDIRILETEMETLKSDIDSLKQQVEQFETVIKDRKAQISSMECLCKEINEAKLIIPTNILEELSNVSQALKEAKTQLSNEQANEKEAVITIDIVEKDIEHVKSKYQVKKTELEKELADDVATIEKLEKSLSIQAKVLDDLQRQEEDVENKLAAQKEIHDFILESVAHLLPDCQLNSSKTL